MNDPRARPPRPSRTAATAVLLVAAAYLVAQLLVVGVHRAPSWDEAVYLSQVTPGTPSLPFAPSRARGITLLVAPVTLAGGSVTIVRAFLTVASAIALGASFLLWMSPVGPATAALGAAIFGFTWVALFYGSEVMPNLWTAFLAVAATGAFTRTVEEETGRGRWAWTAGGLVLLLVLMRPPDGLVVVFALAAFLLVSRRDALRALVPIAGGLALGWAAWLGEMSARFGGPVPALRQAGRLSHLTVNGIGGRVLENLALTDGPTIGPVAHPRVPVSGALWWGVVAVLAGVAVLRAARTAAFRPLVCAAVVGAALAAEYLAFISGEAPRFLLPAYGVLSVPASFGLVSLFREGGAHRAIGWVAAALLAGLCVWQLATARRIGADAMASRASYREVGDAVGRLAEGHPCFVGADAGFPEVAFAARCGGRELHRSDPLSIDDLVSTARGSRVFVVFRSRPEAGSPLLALKPKVMRVSGVDWLIYALPDHPM